MPSGQYKRPIRPILFVIGPSIAYVQLTQGMFSVIEDDDAIAVGRHNWQAHRESRCGIPYAQHRIPGGHEGLHTFLNGLSMNDQKNRQSLDNRRHNLRPADASENAINRGVRRDNVTGLKGVHWRPKAGKYVASIKISGKYRYLGYFNDAQSAHQAYCEAAREGHGEFARLS